MIKFTVTSEMRFNKIRTLANVDIGGSRDALVYEVAHILRDFDRLGESILTDAFEILINEKIKEKKTNV